jgi:hypothetical protein
LFGYIYLLAAVSACYVGINASIIGINTHIISVTTGILMAYIMIDANVMVVIVMSIFYSGHFPLDLFT